MTMRWEDERYVRVYTRDTPDWLCLSFPAQGLFCLLLRKVDRAGLLPLGRVGKKGAAVAIGHAHQWAMLEPALDELLADGCVQINGDTLVIPNFIEAQEAIASDAQRAREYRARQRDGVTAGTRTVTPRHATPGQRDGSDTKRDGSDTERDKTVTPSRTVPNRTEPAEREARALYGLDRQRQVWAAEHPVCAALLETLKAGGLVLTPSRRAEVTEAIEADTQRLGYERAAAVVVEAHAEDPNGSIGWYAKALHRAAAAPPRDETPLPAPDSAWLDAHPGSRERWAAYEHEVLSKPGGAHSVREQLAGAVWRLQTEFEEEATA